MSKNLNLRISRMNALAHELYDIKHKEQETFNVLIIGHATPLPDGDCICSANALANLLSDLMPMAAIDVKFWENANNYIDGVRYFINDIIEDKPYLETFGVKEEGLGNTYYKYVFVVDTDFGRTNFTGSMFDKIGQPEKVFVIDHHGLRECADDIRPTEAYDRFCVFGIGEHDKSPSTSELILILSIELRRLIDAKNASGKSYENTITTETLLENYKVCMGGIQTDTGGFLYEGFQLSLEAISYCLEWIPYDNWEDFQVKQENLSRMRYFLKNPKDNHVYSTLHSFVKNYGNRIGYLIIDKTELGNSAVKPITVLQDYDFDAMIAITIDKKSDTSSIKCELRSTRPSLNCRDIAKSIDVSGGGHIQAAGVTIEILNDKVAEVVDNIVKKFGLEMERNMKIQ